MFKRLFGRRPCEDASHALYTAVINQARRPEFYLNLAVADTVDGRFDLISLHLFLVLHRLGKDRSRDLSQALFDLMFADMDQNLREMGVTDTGVGVRIKKMVSALYGRIDAYEPALADPAVLSAALARNLYRGDAVADEIVAAMARYVISQSDLLASQDIGDIEQGRVRFGDPVMP